MIGMFKKLVILSTLLVSNHSFAGEDTGGFVTGSSIDIDTSLSKYNIIQEPIQNEILVPEFLFSWIKNGVKIIEVTQDSQRFFMGIVAKSDEQIQLQNIQGRKMQIESAQYENQINCRFTFLTVDYLKVNCQ